MGLEKYKGLITLNVLLSPPTTIPTTFSLSISFIIDPESLGEDIFSEIIKIGFQYLTL